MIDFGDATQDLLAVFRITAEQREEAWQIACEQAPNLAAIEALEARLHKRLELLRNREAPADVERVALAALAVRRDEITASHNGKPDVAGHSPEAQAAHNGTEAQT